MNLSQKNYSLVSGLIFLAIALLHITRLLYGWEAAIGSWTVPMWLSWAALVISSYLAHRGITFGKK